MIEHFRPSGDVSTDMGAQPRNLLYIDMAYTTSSVQERQHEQFFEARHSRGYFSRVWGVHPLADRVLPRRRRKIEVIRFSDRQIVIEGAAELYRFPKALLPLNFLLSQLKIVRMMVRIIRTRNVSAVAATDPLYSGLLGLLLKRICRKPLIIHVMGNYDDLHEATGALAMPSLVPFRWMQTGLVRFVLRRADLVAAGSQTLVTYVERNGVRPENIALFPVSKYISPNHLEPPESRVDPADELARLGVPAADTYLMSVARLEPLKHVDDALEAMKIVLDAAPAVVGLFAGSGSLRSTLEARARELGIASRVMFLGNVDQEVLSRILPRCVTLSPLTGMALFECALGQSPVVAYVRDEMTAELVRNGESGFLVPFRDWKAMGRGALELVQNLQLRLRMGRRIREIALEITDLERVYKNENQAFDRMFLAFAEKGVLSMPPDPVDHGCRQTAKLL